MHGWEQILSCLQKTEVPRALKGSGGRSEQRERNKVQQNSPETLKLITLLYSSDTVYLEPYADKWRFMQRNFLMTKNVGTALSTNIPVNRTKSTNWWKSDSFGLWLSFHLSNFFIKERCSQKIHGLQYDGIQKTFKENFGSLRAKSS